MVASKNNSTYLSLKISTTLTYNGISYFKYLVYGNPTYQVHNEKG